MAIFNWDGITNFDLKILGQAFDFRNDVLQISDPSLQAQQFDLFEVGTDTAIIKARDTAGTPLAAADVRYAYLPNVLLRQLGGTDPAPVTSNVVLSNGGQFWVGDRLTDTVTDDAGNDITLLSTQLNSVQVIGLGGNDTIWTGDGNDRIYANTGADSVNAGAGNDSAYGGQENDVLFGGSGNDNVSGDIGNDNLNGGPGNDILYGGAGNDIIDPDSGNDTLFAGNGNDTVSLGNSDTGDKLIYMDKLQDRVLIVSTSGDHTGFLGDNNDHASMTANAGDIIFFGEGGNDTIESQNFGLDSFDGGVDDDLLTILNQSQGQKHLLGDFGRDTLINFDTSGFASSQILPVTQVTMNGGEGNDYMMMSRGLYIADANDGGTGSDILFVNGETVLQARDQSIQNIETVNLSDESDALVLADGNVASGASMRINAGSDDDSIIGSRETNGTLYLFGDQGDDTLVGGSGMDSIEGGSSDDLLVGGGSGDQFRLLGNWSENNYSDFIQDFTGNVDKMVFRGNAFNDISAVDGYKGTAGDSSTQNDNLLIATGQGYASITAFDAFLSAGLADTDKPGFYIFFNTSSSRGEIWFDTNMTSVGGAILVATFNNITAVNQLAQFNEGPAGNNSGDFVII
ncbi:MAG: calcium-binding protein [Alphaproteobacteria bacterium]